MPKKGDFEASEMGNWNVASDFSKYKIMKPLADLDVYETIALFGTSDLVEEFVINEEVKHIARLKAIKRMIMTLRLLINNSKFAVKKGDKEKMDEYLTLLKKFVKILPQLEDSSENQKIGRRVVTVKEKEFGEVLNHLSDMKSAILEPLNRADLIFTHKDEFNPLDFKNKVKEDFIEGG